MSLGVARLKPYAFARFHDWLMEDKEEPPALDNIIAKAYEHGRSRRPPRAAQQR